MKIIKMLIICILLSLIIKFSIYVKRELDYNKNLSENYKKYSAMKEDTSDYCEDITDDEPYNREEPTLEWVSAGTVSGTIYSYESLLDIDFLKSNFYTITSITSLNEENFNPYDALNRDLSIVKDSKEPQILIFHSHASEGYVDSVDRDINTNIVGVGAYLAKTLEEKYGYNVIHDKTTFDMLDGHLDRGKAYNYSNAAVDEWLKKYPSIQVVLDIHRDGVDDKIHLVSEINGKTTAQIMFFNGISYTNELGFIEYLKNPYLSGNLSMSLQMQLMSKAYYEGLTRRIYIQGYRYSEHHADRSMLIEVGAQNNTYEEAINAMDPLADILDKVLSGKKAYSAD